MSNTILVLSNSDHDMMEQIMVRLPEQHYSSSDTLLLHLDVTDICTAGRPGLQPLLLSSKVVALSFLGMCNYHCNCIHLMMSTFTHSMLRLKDMS